MEKARVSRFYYRNSRENEGRMTQSARPQLPRGRMPSVQRALLLFTPGFYAMLAFVEHAVPL